MKSITISLPCYNEEDNINEVVKQIEDVFNNSLHEYNYIIQFSDNCSTDKTRAIIEDICKKDPHVRAIFNSSNVSGSAIHSLLQADGDCCIHMASDLQDPPSLIPELVRKWEQGSTVVCAIKKSSKENKVMWKIRSIYYKIMCKFSSVPQIEHFTGFGLYDREFLEILRRVEDPLVTLRGLVAEFVKNREEVYYTQPSRLHGKSKKNILKYFDYAMRNYTTYTKIGIHIGMLFGFFLLLFSFILFVILLVLKYMVNIEISVEFIILMFVALFIGGLQLFFLGLIGEYVLFINVRTQKRPLAIETKRIGNWGQSKIKPENVSPYISFPK